ncbi:MAG: hypothetical protein J6X24_06965 [Firmicutes bacterium]|nr:hypothetical protein [Bacillota bacterium]
MSADRMVNVRLYDPDNSVEWKGELPASTQLYALTDLLYEKGLKPFQPIGYAYIAAGHLCNNIFTLADYMPEDADSIELRIFDYPQVLLG